MSIDFQAKSETQGKCKAKKRSRRDDFDDLEADFDEIVAEMDNDFSGKTGAKTKPSGEEPSFQ